MRIQDKILPIDPREQDYFVRVYSGCTSSKFLTHHKFKEGMHFFDRSDESKPSHRQVYVSDSLKTGEYYAIYRTRQKDCIPIPVILEGIVLRSQIAGFEKLGLGIALPVQKILVPWPDTYYKVEENSYQREWGIEGYLTFAPGEFIKRFADSKNR